MPQFKKAEDKLEQLVRMRPSDVEAIRLLVSRLDVFGWTVSAGIAKTVYSIYSQLLSHTSPVAHVFTVCAVDAPNRRLGASQTCTGAEHVEQGSVARGGG